MGTAAAHRSDALSLNRKTPVRLVAIYAFAGLLWIFLSDRLLESIFEGPALLSRFQTFKGLLFIGVTTSVLYILLERHRRSIRQSEQALAERGRELAERVRHLQCLYSTARLLRPGDNGNDLPGNDLLTLLVGSLRHPEAACARLRLGGSTFATHNYCDMPRKLTRPVEGPEEAGSLELAYLEGHADDPERAFTRQEIDLVEAVAAQIGEYLVRRHTASLLRETLGTLQAVFDATPLAIVALDAQGQVRAWNPAAERIFGWSRAETLDQPYRLVPPEDRAEFDRAFAAQLQGQVLRHQTRRLTKDGRLLEVDVSSAPLLDGRGRIVGSVSVLADITERKKLEEQLRRATKMEALGRLAGGIAHDFNNLLMAIGGYSELLLSVTDESDPRHEDLIEILNATERAAVLVRQLLTFSRRRETQPELLQIDGVVRSLLRLLQRTIGEDVRLEATLPEDLWPTWADPGQVEQVLMNLTVNARDAMPGGGILAIEARNVCIGSEEDAVVDDVPAGRYVLLNVSDTGTGMSEETRSHIFEPFFTTKPEGLGTGLGLATVYGIAQRHGAHIRVDSALGRGSSFRIYWPAAPEDRQGLPLRAGDPAESGLDLVGSERVLLVEDEESVRRMARIALESYGYRVVTAADPAQAMELFHRHRDDLDLLLSDVVLPGASGPGLYRRMAAESPRLKALFISGYSYRLAEEQGLTEDMPLLEKPFSLLRLAEAVRRALDTRR